MISIDAGAFPLPIPPSTFPLKPGEFGVTHDKCQCSFRFEDIAVRGRTYALRTWLGAHASVTERTQLGALVRSIAPLSR